MGSTTKDSFQESNRHTKVVFQKGKDCIDFELNEFQDILRVQQYRALVAESGGLNPGSNDDGYLVTGTGASNAVTLKAGVLFCDGIPVILEEDLTYDDLTTNGGGSPVINTVYLQVSEQEVPDPAMIPQLGETSRRRKLFVEVGHVVGTTLPADEPPVIWQGGTRYFALAHITRNPGVAAIQASNVSDLRKRLPAFTVKRLVDQFYLDSGALASHQHNYNPPGISDAFVLRFNPTVPVNLTGMNADVQYRRKTIVNTGTQVLSILAENVASVAANRFINGTDIQPNGAVEATYDYGAARWRLLLAGEAAQIPDEIVITDSPFTEPDFGDPYNPPGWDLATVVRIDVPEAGFFMQGMAPASRKRKLLINIGAGTLGLPSESYGPPASSQLRAGKSDTSMGFSLEPWTGALFLYSDATQRWELASPAIPTSLFLKSLGINEELTLADDVDISYLGLPVRHTMMSLEDFAGDGWQDGPNGKYLEAAGFAGGGTVAVTIPTGSGDCYNTDGPGNVTVGTTVAVYNVEGGSSSASRLRAPIKLPKGAVLQKVEFLVQDTASVQPGTPMKATLINRSLPLDPSPENGGGSDGWTNASESNQSMSHVGFQLLTINVNITVDNSLGSLGLRVSPSNGVTGASRLWWVRLSWKDPGARNH